MMTLMARLCALCAVSALMQMAMPDEQASAGLRLVGALLMLRLVLSGAKELEGLLTAGDLAGILEGMMR